MSSVGWHLLVKCVSQNVLFCMSNASCNMGHTFIVKFFCIFMIILFILYQKFVRKSTYDLYFQAYSVGRALTLKLKELIPRQMFKIPIQVRSNIPRMLIHTFKKKMFYGFPALYMPNFYFRCLLSLSPPLIQLWRVV